MHKILYMLFFLLPAAASNASEFSIRGYGTVGAVHAASSGAEYIRDLGQRRGVSEGKTSARIDSRFGLQLDYLHNYDLSFTAQVLSKYQADETYTPEIAWAFVKYKILPELEIKVGRTNIDFVFQTDEVNLGFTSLTVRPPIDFYSLPLRASDGIDMDYSIPYKNGYVTTSLSIGVATNDEIPIVESYYDMGGSPLLGGSLNYETMDWSLKLSYGQMKHKDNPQALDDIIALYQPVSQEFTDSLNMKDKWTQYYSLGGLWNRGAWSGVAAIGAYRTKTRSYPSSDILLAKLGYRIRKLTPFIAFSSLKAVQDPITINTGTLLDVVASSVQKSFLSDQKTYSVGARYDLTSNIAIKTQYDIIDSDSEKTSTIKNKVDDWDGSMELFSIALDYYF